MRGYFGSLDSKKAGGWVHGKVRIKTSSIFGWAVKEPCWIGTEPKMFLFGSMVPFFL